MAYFHVLLKFRDEPSNTRCLYSDLSEKSLRGGFVKDYERGRTILHEGELIDLTRITSVAIIRTSRTEGEERDVLHRESVRKIDELNRSSSSVFIISAGSGYAPEDIAEAGDDVTSKYVSGPPGSSFRAVVGSFVNNPWIVGVGTALVAAGLAWWIGWS